MKLLSKIFWTIMFISVLMIIAGAIQLDRDLKSIGHPGLMDAMVRLHKAHVIHRANQASKNY